MPYDNIEKAKKAGFPTIVDGIPLTLEQINRLAEIYDALKNAENLDNPMAVAFTQWKREYKKQLNQNRWVRIEKVEEKGSNTFSNEEDITSNKNWIRVARKDQVSGKPEGRRIRLTESALQKSEGTWKGGKVLINHKEKINHKIKDAKYISPFLYMLFDDETRKLFKNTDASGWSVVFDGDSLVYDADGNIIDGKGTGISILYPPHRPSCTPALGCFESFYDMNNSENTVENAEISSIIEGIKKGFDKVYSFFKTLSNNKENEGKNEVKKQEKMSENRGIDGKEEGKEGVTQATQSGGSNNELEKIRTELEDLKSKYAQREKELLDKIKELEEKEAERERRERDGEFEDFITKIPPGWVDTEDKKKQLRERFETSPTTLLVDVAGMERPVVIGVEGNEYSGAQKLEEVGYYDPYKGEYISTYRKVKE